MTAANAVLRVDFSALQLEVADIKRSLTDAVKFITGNGDPTKGLLWVTSDLSRLMAANTQLLEAHRQMLERHISDSDARFARHLEVAHQERRSEFWEKVKDTAVKQIVTGVIVVTLGLLALGIVTFVRNGGHL